jgi:hypothetical protein
MSTDELLAIIRDRGLNVVLRPDGSPALRGAGDLSQEASPRLLRVLRLPAHREAIVARLTPPPCRQWLWKYGHRFTEPEPGAPGWHPAGAWWWRTEGEKEWQAVPGRPGEAEPPPEGA